MATGLRKAASRFYGMPITKEILAARREHLADLEEEDLVKAHLLRNGFFGGIDKTLSGFVILDDEGDNYYLLDLRDTGQVYFQDHEDSEISLTFATLGDYLDFLDFKKRKGDDDDEDEYIRKLRAAEKGKKSGKAVATIDLARRYQWLVGFYSQPMKGHHFRDYAKGPDVFENDEAGLATYERERGLLATDVHLALYWLLHWTAYTDLAKVNDVIAATGTPAPEVFAAFAERFSRLQPTETLEDILSDFRQRRALFMLSRWEIGLARVILSFEMDPKYLGFEKLFLLMASDPDGQYVSELEQAILRMDETEVTVAFAKALIDKRRGKKESEAAAQFARLLIKKEKIGRYELAAFSQVGAMIADQKLVIAATDAVLRQDPYNRQILELLLAALRKVGEKARAARVEDLCWRLGEIRPLVSQCVEGGEKIEEAMKQAESLPDEKKRLFAERILYAAADFPMGVVAQSLIWIIQLGSPARAELLLRVLQLQPSYVIKSLLGVMRKAMPYPDEALAADLCKVMSSVSSVDPVDKDDFRSRMHQLELVETITGWLNEATAVKGTTSNYDALLDLLESPGNLVTKETIIQTALNRYEEKSYILDRFNDEQAKRAARVLIELNHEAIEPHLFYAAGHQLCKFDHKGAEDVLVEALNHEHEKEVVSNLYSAVRNMKTESSREALIERLFTETEHYRWMAYALEEIFSDEVHARILHLLHERKSVDAADRYTDALRYTIMKDPPLIDLLKEVLTWQAPDSAELKSVLLEGTRAALAQKQFELVITAYSRAERIQGAVYDPFSDPKNRKELDSVLSGQALKTQKKLDQASAAHRASGMADVKITDRALGLLARTTLAKRILHDPESGVVWFINKNREFFYFDGFGIVDPPFKVEMAKVKMDVRSSLSQFLKPVSRFTRRLSFWTRDVDRYIDCTQYENRIVYQAGEGRGFINSGKIETSFGVIARDIEDATRWMELLKKCLPKGYRESEPWYVCTKGAIERKISRNEESDHLTMLVPRPAPDTPSPQELTLEKEILDHVHRGGSLGSVMVRRDKRRPSDTTVVEFLRDRCRHDHEDAIWHIERLDEFRNYFEKYGWEAVLPKLELAHGAGVPQNDIDQYQRSRGKAFPGRLRDFWRKVGWAQWRVGEQGARVLPPGEVQERNKDGAIGKEIFIVSLSGQAIARIAEISPPEAYDPFALLLATEFLWRLVDVVEEIAPHTRMVMYGSTYPESIITERLETQAGPSAKFWEVILDSGRNYISTRDGRVGADGKVSTKHFDSLEEAKAVYEQLIAGKKQKGYRKVSA